MRKIKQVLMIGFFLGIYSSSLQATTLGVNDNFPITDGTVNAIVSDSSSNIYIGGRFSYVGPHTGTAVPVDSTTGQASASYPKVDGTVNAIVPDGQGGWYLGGNFTRVGNSSQARLAHVLSNGSVDPAWSPVLTNGSVNAIAVGGTPTSPVVYVGGSFILTANTPMQYLAAFNSTGQPVSGWAPQVSGAASALALDTTGTNPVLVAGGLGYVVTIDSGGTTTKRWDVTNGQSTIKALAFDGSYLYVGGDFGRPGGAAGWSANLVRLRLTEDTPDPGWAPSPTGGVVNSLALAPSSSSEKYLYVGGTFTGINGGAPIKKAARILISTNNAVGNADSNFAPAFSISDTVSAITPIASAVYMGGAFGISGVYPRKNVAAYDLTRRDFNGWDPKTNGPVFALAVNGTSVYVGGGFSSVNGVERKNLAALSPTGQISSWAPNIPNLSTSQVNALAIDSSQPGSLYVGGAASAPGTSDSLFTVSTNNSGQIRVINLGTSGTINALLVRYPRLYTGGQFLIPALYVFDLSTNQWGNLNPLVAGPITSLAINGNFLYAGVYQAGPPPQVNILSWDIANSPSILRNNQSSPPWNLQTSFNGAINAIDTVSNNLFLGGDYTDSRLINPNGLSNAPTVLNSSGTNIGFPNAPLNSRVGFNGPIKSLLLNGNTLYLGGSFNVGQFFSCPAAVGPCRLSTSRDIGGFTGLDATTGMFSANINTPVVFGIVNTIKSIGNNLYVGGSFTTVDGTSRWSLAQLVPQTVKFSSNGTNGPKSTTSVNIPVTLSTVSSSNVTLTYRVAGTASSPTDFSTLPGTFTIPAFNQTASIPLTIVNNGQASTAKQITLTLTGATGADLDATPSNLQFTYTIDAFTGTGGTSGSSGSAGGGGGGSGGASGSSGSGGSAGSGAVAGSGGSAVGGSAGGVGGGGVEIKPSENPLVSSDNSGCSCQIGADNTSGNPNLLIETLFFLITIGGLRVGKGVLKKRGTL